MKLPLLSVISLALFFISAAGQQTAIYDDPLSGYREAVNLFEKEKYGAARNLFQDVAEKTNGSGSEMYVSSRYYDALCAYFLYHGDAEFSLLRFAEDFPEHTRNSNINFYLGADAFRNKKYTSASKYFEKVDLQKLSPDEKEEYHFKAGYADFKSDRFKEARQHFVMVKDGGSMYAVPAGYFYGHIVYAEGDYETALNEFRKISGDPTFGPIVPYYIIQILFYQEKYKEVATYGPSLLEDATEKRRPEIIRLIGESWFREKNYEKAREYLEQYNAMPGVYVDRGDYYQLGFVQFKLNDYEPAILNLQKAAGPNDTLSQYAYYYLAHCYLKTDKKQYAGNAFLSAHKLPFNREISEDALFNHAQLAYELSFDPYSEAVNALKQYLDEYPNSSRNDEAYSFLYNIAAATRNYGEALRSLEKIKSKGPDYETNLQKMRYAYAIELFNAGKADESVVMFAKAGEYKSDPKTAALCLFWTAEAYYRQMNISEAANYYSAFQQKPAAYKTPEYNLAHYNQGYIAYHNKNYEDAVISFRKFITGNASGNKNLVSDASLRTADSYYLRSMFEDAIFWYDRAAAMKQSDMDYALYQKAVCLGALSRTDEKTKTLNRLISDYPDSPLMTDALYELGNTWLLLKENEKALLSYKKVIDEYPSSSFVAGSMLKTGLIYYNSGQNDLALSTFKNVVTKYPATPESREALVSLRNIYVDINRVDEFFRYVKDLSFADISQAEQDSITYIAAENQYLNNSCESSIKAFQGYLENFPSGSYTSQAYYYMAECYQKTNQTDMALESYKSVAALPRSKFTETSLLNAARIAFTLKRYEDAFGFFYELEQTAENKLNLVEARYGQMKCNYILEKFDNAVASADKLLGTDKISDERQVDALMIRAKSNIAIDKTGKASEDFTRVLSMTSNASAAEAKYHLALIQYIEGRIDQSEKEVFEMINTFAAYDYWVAKSFILLADIYLQKDNLFQAKQTLRSIIDNYEGPELGQLAREKLEAVEKMESAQKAAKPAVTDTIDDEIIEILINNEKNRND
ncbi:MAG: tetratricopeptide repeat protein [Bacteroidales bacterium]|nr:tetratricopeptide repeat protein [Bacteroidales bacterium]